MCKTCDDGICTNRCATKTTVTKVTKITPPPVEGAIGDESDREHGGVNELFDQFFPRKKEGGEV
jgi:hypothetical protein